MKPVLSVCIILTVSFLLRDQSALGPLLLHGSRPQCGHKMTEHKVPDLPPGPLDVYRKKASFNWKEMLLFLEGEDVQEFKVTSAPAPSGYLLGFYFLSRLLLTSPLQQHVFRTLENDPLFARRPGEDVPVEKMRELTFLRYAPLLHFCTVHEEPHMKLQV